jgi:hypothetical protein
VANSGAERLKEFYVALGFEVDEQQFRNFGKTIEKVTANIAEIGAAVAIAATLIDKNVTVIAARFEKLYYASSRTGSSVKNLEDIEYGAQQIGFQAGQATGQIESMTSALRSNPGLAALFGTNDKDPTKQFTSIIDKLKAMDNGPFGHAIAARYAGMLGISEPDFVMYEKGNDKLKALMAERDKQFRDAGLDPDKVAQRSVDFQNDMRKLSATVDIIETLIAERFMPGIDRLINGLGKIVSLVANADKATGGASTYGIGAVGVAGAFGGIKLLQKVIAGMLRSVGVGGVAGEGAAAGAGVAEGAAVAGGAEASAAVFLPIVAAILAGLGLGWLLNKAGALDAGGKLSAHSEVNAVRKFFGLDGSNHPDSVLSDGAVKRNNPGNLRSWGDAPTSGGFAVFNSAIDGLSAMAGQLRRYAARHLDTIQSIVSTYAPPGDHNDTEAYIRNVAKRMGVSAGAHLDLNSPGTLQALMHAMIQQEQGKDPYSTSTLQSAIAQRLTRDGVSKTGGNHTLNLETKVTVNGAGDSKAVAKGVGDEQARVNQDAMRNFLAKVN